MKPRGLTSGILILCLGLFCASCSEPKPEALRYGEDTCDYCRMNIVEQNFGSELVTKKRKIFKFDSIECLVAFVAAAKVSQDEIHSKWVTDFAAPLALIDVMQASVVHTDMARSPMGVGLFGFSDEKAARDFAVRHGGEILDWSALEALVVDTWDIE